MFKRMSILVRRPAMDRAGFSRHWAEVHGPLIRALPQVRAYVQNHVVEEFAVAGAGAGLAGYRVDGVVELYFDVEADMARAFDATPAAAVKADEPAFLGHGTGYAIAGDAPWPAAPLIDGSKLLVMVDAPWPDAAEFFAALPGWQGGHTDTVATVIARPEMATGPQPVHHFHHLRFQTAASAAQGGAALAEHVARAAQPAGIGRIGICRVVEKTIV